VATDGTPTSAPVTALQVIVDGVGPSVDAELGQLLAEPDDLVFDRDRHPRR
jgi:hypothetical protein